jgi:hypothetical protein
LIIVYFLVLEQQVSHLIKYPSGEHLNKTPPSSPNPSDVAVTSTVVSHPQSEQLPFIAIVDFFGFS